MAAAAVTLVTTPTQDTRASELFLPILLRILKQRLQLRKKHLLCFKVLQLPDGDSSTF